MDSGKGGLDSIAAYIAQFPVEVQERLRMLRKVIRDEAPEAEEKISYRMPTFVLHGNLVHFAAFKNHIGLYPAPSGVEAFIPELSAYRSGKGSIQFPMDKPLPSELIRKIVKFRVAENIKRADERLKNKVRKG
ncbi:MAG: iron chaperone [Candidatus Cryosericum sp.]